MALKLKKLTLGACILAGAATTGTAAHADRLDDVLSAGTVRCAVVLDFPPMGFRDENNNPTGLDVDVCKDLAKALGVEAEIVGVTWAERIPSLISGKTDVVIASSSDTLERAKTVGLSIPYMVTYFQALLPENSTVTKWEELKDKKVGAAVGTTYESNFVDFKAQHWPDSKGEFVTFQSENESFMAAGQGRVDATIGSDTSIANIVKSGKFGKVKLGPIAPFGKDITAFMTLREEYGWLNYLNLFINHEHRNGRLQELYGKYVGGTMPDLTTPGVYR
ncbi:amino acid ABC transporter substrate-binding protein [Rhizobium anhuiense]|nr:transporter substrate-binding domain-containing protein [Rhizobium anhuiense]PDS59939.1 amino acid ABC transporter substrate-binding protein [Rhizobium anhuiense]